MHLGQGMGRGRKEDNEIFHAASTCPGVGVTGDVNLPVPLLAQFLLRLSKCGHSATLSEVHHLKDHMIYVQHGFCIQSDC